MSFKRIYSLALFFGLSASLSVSFGDDRVMEIIEAHDLQNEYQSSVEYVNVLSELVDPSTEDGSVIAQIMLEAKQDTERLKGQYLGWDSISPLFVEVYREAFTEEELNLYASLLKDPVYLSILDKEEMIGQKLGQIIQDRVAAYLDKQSEVSNRLSKKFDDYIAEQIQLGQ